MIDEKFDSEAEPYFQQTIRYIITGDATNVAVLIEHVGCEIRTATLLPLTTPLL
jgi:hypothetical protein